MPFATVVEKLQELPEEYLTQVAEYIDSIKIRIVENSDAKTEKIDAFNRVWKMRKPIRKDFNPDKELELALREKYGFAS